MKEMFQGIQTFHKNRSISYKRNKIRNNDEYYGYESNYENKINTRMRINTDKCSIDQSDK